MTDGAATPSWDAERTQAPQRPRFSSSLPAEDLIPRPRRMLVALVLAIVAALAWLTIVALGALDLDSLRLSLVDALPEDLRTEYEEATQQSAASIMLGVVAGLGTVVVVAQLLAMRAIVVGHTSLARIVYAVATVIQIPVTLVALLLAGDATTSIVLGGVAVTCAIVALVLLLTPRASRWLRQGEAPRSIPIAAAAP